MASVRPYSSRPSLAPLYAPPSAAKILSTRFLSLTFFTNRPALSLIKHLHPFPLSHPTLTSRPGGFRIYASSPGPGDPRTQSEEDRLQGVHSFQLTYPSSPLLFRIRIWESH